MLKKLIMGAGTLVVAGTILTACGSSDEANNATNDSGEANQASEPPAETEDKPVEIIFTSVSVSGDSHTDAMYQFKDRVEELSNGSIEVKVYDNGSLFSAENEYDAVVNGEADMAYLSFPTLATQIPSYSMFGSGYFFSSYEHMNTVLNGDIAKAEIWPQIESELGIIPLGSMYLGSRVINTRNTEINRHEDMKGLLLRMPNSEAWLFLGEALGANPTPLSFSELYTALQTGAVDAQDNPLPTIESAKFYEVTEYIAITNHVIDSIMPVVNKGTWDSMSTNQQDIIRQAMEEAIEFNDKARIENENKLISFFESEGLTVTYPDINEFKANVQDAYNNDSTQTAEWNMELYDKIQSIAK